MSRMNNLPSWTILESRDGVDTRKKDLTGAVADIKTEFMVPYSVKMRELGKIRHRWYDAKGKRVTGWVTEQERDYLVYCDQMHKLRRSMLTEPKVMNWFAVMQAEEEDSDAQFVELTEAAWNAWKNNDIRAWGTAMARNNGLIFWDRINRKRAINTAREHADLYTNPGWTLERDMAEEPWKY